jgi:hypothetical protein
LGARTQSWLTFFFTHAVALPKPNGGTVPAVFFWDVYQDALELVTDVPTFVAATYASEPHDQQPVQVVRYTPLLRSLRHIDAHCVEGVFGVITAIERLALGHVFHEDTLDIFLSFLLISPDFAYDGLVRHHSLVSLFSTVPFLSPRSASR